MRETKQIIVMRTDLNMRKGKMIAQGAHASIAFLTQNSKKRIWKTTGLGRILYAKITDPAQQWLEESFVKICVRVDSEEELYEIQAKALAAKLEVHMVTDAGRTEFNGVPTNTCLAIGPNFSDEIDAVTGHLKLL